VRLWIWCSNIVGGGGDCCWWWWWLLLVVVVKSMRMLLLAPWTRFYCVDHRTDKARQSRHVVSQSVSGLSVVASLHSSWLSIKRMRQSCLCQEVCKPCCCCCLPHYYHNQRSAKRPLEITDIVAGDSTEISILQRIFSLSR